MPAEFVALGDEGRRYQGAFRVRLGESDASGLLRLDGIARYLQDVAADDWADTGFLTNLNWVVRQTALRRVSGAPWPRYLDAVTLTTWCGGVGAAWAERRTDIAIGSTVVIQAAAIWVPLSAGGYPVRIQPHFFEVYGEAARGRKVSARVVVEPVIEGAARQSWLLRESDFDIIGHANNATLWQSLAQIAAAPFEEVVVIHHGSVERGDQVLLEHVPGRLWLTVDGAVKVSAQYSPT